MRMQMRLFGQQAKLDFWLRREVNICKGDKRPIEYLSIFLIRDLSGRAGPQCQASKTTGKQGRYQLPIDLSIDKQTHTRQTLLGGIHKAGKTICLRVDTVATPFWSPICRFHCQATKVELLIAGRNLQIDILFGGSF